MKKVLININFKDVYTGELYVAGEYATFTEERITEINAVNPNFVTVVGNAETPVEAPKKQTKKNNGKKAETPVENPAGDTEKPSVEDLIDDLENSPEE